MPPRIIVAMILCLGMVEAVEAAKGVKKVIPVNSQHTVSGHILNITHQNGVSTLHIRSGYRHRKFGTATNVTGKHHTHTFYLSAATRVEHRNGTAGGLGALHRGERVRVRAVGKQAANVHILGQMRIRGYFARHRIHNYRPHLHHSYHHHHYHPRR